MRCDRHCNRDVIILLLLMASQTRPASISPRALGACAAVTADDLQGTLGISFRRGQGSSAGKQSTCDYAIGNAQVSVTIQRLDGAVDIAAEMEAMKREMPGVTVRRLEEASFIVEIPGAGANVTPAIGIRGAAGVTSSDYDPTHCPCRDCGHAQPRSGEASRQ